MGFRRAKSMAKMNTLVNTLVGKKLTAVSYAAAQSRKPVVWDYGRVNYWHNPSLGVELLLDGEPFTVTWSHKFTEYSVSISAMPVRDLVTPLAVVEDQTENPRWSPYIGGRVERAQILWNHTRSGYSFPAVAVELRLSGGNDISFLCSEVSPETGFRYELHKPDLNVVFSQVHGWKSTDGYGPAL